MGEATEISWATSTFNPWWGCTNVSPACDHCYAETLAQRWGHDIWGRDKPRRFFEAKHWAEPLRWERRALATGEPWRVFCASMADVFESVPGPVGVEMDEARRQLWSLIVDTPHLTWMLLTKRPENAPVMVPPRWADGWPENVWLGTTVESQRYADLRIPKLIRVPARVRFVSCEPLLGPVNLDWWFRPDGVELAGPPIHWVIAGGESGAHARTTDPDWVRQLRDQCHPRRTVAAFHFKQWGEWAPDLEMTERLAAADQRSLLDPDATTGTVMAKTGRHRSGAVLDGREWREFPE